MIERRPEDRKRLLELLLFRISTIRTRRDPLLDGECVAHKVSVGGSVTHPSPAGQNRTARAADGLRATLEEAKSNKKMPMTRLAAIKQQLAMNRTDAAFGEHPAGSQIAVAPCGLIGSETAETNWGRPGQR